MSRVAQVLLGIATLGFLLLAFKRCGCRTGTDNFGFLLSLRYLGYAGRIGLFVVGHQVASENPLSQDSSQAGRSRTY